MEDIDSFASLLWEQSKRFLEKAENAKSDQERSAFLNSSMMLGFASLEAHVNAIADEFANLASVSVHEKGIMKEREVRLENGAYRLSSTARSC